MMRARVTAHILSKGPHTLYYARGSWEITERIQTESRICSIYGIPSEFRMIDWITYTAHGLSELKPRIQKHRLSDWITYTKPRLSEWIACTKQIVKLNHKYKTQTVTLKSRIHHTDCHTWNHIYSKWGCQTESCTQHTMGKTVRSNHVHSKQTVRLNHVHSKRIVRLNNLHSRRTVRLNHVHSKRTVRLNHVHSKRTVRSNHVHSKRTVRLNHVHSKRSVRLNHVHSKLSDWITYTTHTAKTARLSHKHSTPCIELSEWIMYTKHDTKNYQTESCAQHTADRQGRGYST